MKSGERLVWAAAFAPELLNLCRGFAWCHPECREEYAMRARKLVARVDGEGG